MSDDKQKKRRKIYDSEETITNEETTSKTTKDVVETPIERDDTSINYMKGERQHIARSDVQDDKTNKYMQDDSSALDRKSQPHQQGGLSVNDFKASDYDKAQKEEEPETLYGDDNLGDGGLDRRREDEDTSKHSNEQSESRNLNEEHYEENNQDFSREGRLNLPTGVGSYSTDETEGAEEEAAAADNSSRMGDMGESIKNKMSKSNKQGEAQEAASKAKGIVDTTSKVANTASSLASGLLTLIVNPITWVALALLVSIGIFYSGNQLLGRSDFANNCTPNGSISISGDVFSGDEKERANQFGHWLTTTKFKSLDGKSFTKEDAAAIVGNAHHESKISSLTMEGEMAWGDDSQKYKTYDNEKVLSEWGETYHHAVGLVQWDGIRRVRLVNYAKSKNKQWHDINIQLEFLEDELNEGYAGVVRQLVAASGVEAKTEVWRTKFEVGAQAPGRLGFAKEFMKFFDGGSGGGFGKSSGSVADCSGGGSIDASEIIQLAIDISYPMSDYASSRLVCGAGYDGCGKPESKPGYVQAKALAEENGGKDPLGDLFASCDRLVATLLKATKKDVDIPWGSTYNQASYLAGSPKWQQISCTDRKPGDVLIVPGKHIMMYLGDVDGTDSLASASYRERTSAIGPMSGCSGNYFLADGYTNAIGYRLKE